MSSKCFSTEPSSKGFWHFNHSKVHGHVYPNQTPLLYLYHRDKTLRINKYFRRDKEKKYLVAKKKKSDSLLGSRGGLAYSFTIIIET